MKHNTCPHCGAHITFRERFFAKKGGIHCAQCGEVSYSVTGAFWIASYLCAMYLSMCVQYWYRLSGWLPVVVVGLTVAGLIGLSPLAVSRELPKKEKVRRLVVGLCVFVVLNVLYVWVQDNRPRVAGPAAVCPPTGQSVP